MTKLEMVLERVRQLPQSRQDEIAKEVEFLLDHEGGESLLTPEQEAELGRRLADPARKFVSHEEVGAYFQKKYGQ
jgi:hypothetical protein